MTSESEPSRRGFLGAFGILGVATAAGASMDVAAAAPSGANQERGPFAPAERAAPASRAFGPAQSLMLTGFDFQAESSVNFHSPARGAIQVTIGGADFSMSLRLPAGAKLGSCQVYVNPKGAVVFPQLLSFRPNSPNASLIAGKTSSTGNAVETVTLDFNPVILAANTNYIISSIRLNANGSILHGARIGYQLPK